jgi:hypothetical protein
MKNFTKKKEVLLVIALLGFLNSMTAQKVKKYYNHLHKAEKRLIENKYLPAVRHYKKAFGVNMYFDSDLMNAFRTALLAKKKAGIIFFWNKIKTKPVIVAQLKTNDAILNYPSNIVAAEIKQINEPEYIKTNLEKIADSILSVDQSARHRCGDNLKKECIELFQNIDSTNIYFLESLLSKGKYNRWELSGNWDAAIYGFFIVAKHARRFGHTNLDSILISYIKKGYIKPYWFAVLNGQQTDLPTVAQEKLSALPKLGLGYFYMGINDTIVEFKTNDSLVSVFNKNRKSLFMDDVKTELAKLRFAQSNPLFRNSQKSLGINLQVFPMSEKEAKTMIEDFKQKKLLKE